MNESSTKIEEQLLCELELVELELSLEDEELVLEPELLCDDPDDAELEVLELLEDCELDWLLVLLLADEVLDDVELESLLDEELAELD